nr:hypothetical protein CFP56_00852 [Quercus suber]
MYFHAFALLFVAMIATCALLILDPRPAPTAPNYTIDDNGSTPKPTAPPRFPRLSRQDAAVSVCGSLEGDAQGSVKVCSSESLCIPFDAIATNSWIFACCAYSDEAICETTAVSCLGWSDNDLPYGQSTSQISNGTLLWYVNSVLIDSHGTRQISLDVHADRNGDKW